MHKDSCGLSQLYLRYASKVPRWLLYRSARRVWEWWFKVGPAQPECMAAAICRCFRRLLRGMAQRNASTASFQGCCLASARPPWTLFSPLLAWGGDVHDRLRQATASLLWARPLPRLPSTCMHGRVRLLGRSNPPPVPISPSSQHTTQTLFLDNITPPPAPLDQHLPNHSDLISNPRLLPQVLFPLTTGHPSQPVSPSPFLFLLLGSSQLLLPRQFSPRDIRTPAGAPQTSGPSIITPARPRLFNTHLQIHLDDFFAIGLPAFTCCVRLDPSPLLL